jgi:vacuolar-type H+-ATPase subunit F/Vma7
MKNDDTFRSFLSMGAQLAEEVRRRLDEAAEAVGNPSNATSNIDINLITEAVLADIRSEITTEVERAITRIGVAREDELASLRARIEKLEK